VKRFSIIIPTYNRPRQLSDCLESLLRLDYPQERFEVVVTDDGSAPPLDTVVEPYRQHLDLTLVRTRNGGPGAARNSGAQRARGEFFAFTDDDCRPHVKWLSSLEAALDRTPDHMVGGRTVNQLTDNPFSTASQVIVDAAYRFYNRNPSDARFLASNNMVVPARLFCDMGGFDTDFRIASEDRELCDRWRFAGHRISYASQAVVYHAHALSLYGFCRQHFRYGRGARRYHHVRGRRGSGRLRDDMRFHANLIQILREPLSRLPVRHALRVCAALILWQASNAAGFFYEGIREDGALAGSVGEVRSEKGDL
jgi:GT2 family glycosyltransferase